MGKFSKFNEANYTWYLLLLDHKYVHIVEYKVDYEYITLFISILT